MAVDPNSAMASCPPTGTATVTSSAVAVRRALEQFSSLTGRQPETVTGMRSTGDGGWSVLVDVLELERVPDSTSVLATYRIDLDAKGELCSCERLRRFHRGATDVT